MSKLQAPQSENHDKMAGDALSLKDVLELVRSMTGGSSSGWEKLAEVMIVRELIQALRQQPPPTQVPQNSSNWMDKIIDFYIAMEFLNTIKQGTAGKDRMKEILEMVQLFKSVQSGQLTPETLIQLLNQTHERYAELIKQSYEDRLKQQQEYNQKVEQIINLVQEILQRWDKERLEMFQRFEETLRRMYEERRPAEEIRRFVQEFMEYQKLMEQLKEAIKGTELEKQPIYDEKSGQINIDKILYYIDRWFFRGASTELTPPPKKTRPATSLEKPTAPPMPEKKIEVPPLTEETKEEKPKEEAKKEEQPESPKELPEPLPVEGEVQVVEGK